MKEFKCQKRYRLMWMDTKYEPGTVKVVAYDKDGILCRDADRLVKFYVKDLPQMTLFNGMLTAIVQTTEEAGQITLEATAKGLKKGKIVLENK